MFRSLIASLALLSLLGTGPAFAKAAPCRDAKGKFTKCVPAKPKQCRDSKGRFAKCGTPGAK